MTLALVPRAPTPDDTALEFLDQLYRDVTGGWATLFSHNRTSGLSYTDWKPIDLRDELAALAMDRTETCCTWFGVATRQHKLSGGRRGGADDCRQVPAVWVDIDIAGPGHKVTDGLPADLDQAMRLLHTCDLAPTCLVHTGGGLQGWWFLDQPREPGEIEHLLRGWGAAWAQRAGAMGLRVDNVFNVDRIMRLPGTVNRKAAPVRVTILDADWDCRYGLDHLEPYTIDPPSPPDERPRSLPYIGAERPGDAFNARHTGAQVLERLGFQPHRPLSNGEQRWTGPWKDPRDGHSATIYPDGRTVIYSDSALAHWPALTIRTRRYLPFDLYTDTFHNGDYSAAARELRKQGYGDPNSVADLVAPGANGSGACVKPVDNIGVQVTPSPAASSSPFIDWPSFWAREHHEAEWLLEPILARGRGHAIYAPKKVGKSLVTLWVVSTLATTTKNISVIYLDYEMTEEDLYERLDDMGYGPDSDLSRLRYAVLPSLPPLDQAEGGAAILALVDKEQAANPDHHIVVIIDTTSRAVAGEENSADTIRGFYRHTGLALKQRGVTWARLDHAGKDIGKGQRGSSAKGDDVDIVWKLARTDNGIDLVRDVARMSWVPDRVTLKMAEAPLAFTLGHGSWPAGTKECADILDRLGLELDITRRTAAQRLRGEGHKASNAVIGAALRYRRTERPLT